MTRSEVLSATIAHYGAKSQINMVFEEFAELQKELCKHLRKFDNVDEIAEEIADVRIMLDQMILIFGCDKSVAYWDEYKLKRLARDVGVEYG